MASMQLEINTTRAIAAQVLRHRSFSFQEFSQRYSSVGDLPTIGLPHLRTQDAKNKQASHDDMNPNTKERLEREIARLYSNANDLYEYLLSEGVAKECARFVLPLATPTRLYMTGTIRSWIHYIDLRSAHGTQKEHMDIAEMVRTIFKEQFPIISEALEWN